MIGKTLENNKKINKRKLIAVIAVIIVLIATTVALCLNKKEKFEITPEIAKSREYTTVKDGDAKTNSSYVEFDAFFLKDLDGDGTADAIRGTCNAIGKEDTVYMELKALSNGQIEDGEITINSENFYFKTSLVKDNEISENYISSNTQKIKLNTIKNGTQKMITGLVRSGDYSSSSGTNSAIGNNINNYSKKNTITFTGTHVADDGTRTAINKTITFDVDWYGTAEASIYNRNTVVDVENMSTMVKDGNLNLSFTIETREDKQELLLKGSYMEAQIPNMNGYAPTDVRVSGRNITYEYNKDTQTLTAKSEAKVSDTGDITSNAHTGTTWTGNGYKRYTVYDVTVTYPGEAYNVETESNIEILVPVKAYYEAYNNPSSQFQNPYVTNTPNTTIAATWRKYAGEAYRFDIYVGRYVGSPYSRYVVSKEKPYKIYNAISEEETEDRYDVSWRVYTGTAGEGQKVIMRESKAGQTKTSDSFIKTDSSLDSMAELTTNVGISFSGAQNFLGSEGYIKVYNDDTDELLLNITSNEWNQNKTYYYDEPVKHIRVETSEASKKSYLYVNNIKELDDTKITQKYTLSQFEQLQYIRSTLVGQFGTAGEDTNVANAYYEAPLSTATISSVSATVISTQATQNEKIKIKTGGTSFNEQKWLNGSFLLRLPKNIEELNVNSVNINDSSVKILGWDAYEENGYYFIKILTENSNEATYSIDIDCDITLDPRLTDRSDEITLYATNEGAIRYYNGTADIYDVNGNLNTTEQVAKSSAGISIVSPKSLLTNQIASNYDGKGSVAIAPRVAKTDKNQRTATVEVNVTNNYSSQISDILIQGVIPFKGNKYIIGDGDLGSNFSTYITKAIEIPDALKSSTTIYYSTNETPTKDLADSANGWTLAENVTDWTKIKTYIISLGDYSLPVNASYGFTYEIHLPEGVEYNQISYSQHAIYFSLNTTEGKYPTLTSASKLGFMIAKQYDFEITKYQANTTKLLPGITFSIKEVETGKESIRTTNEQGKLSLTGLYAERNYEITELKTTEDYVSLGDTIRLYASVDDQEQLHINFKNEDGTTAQQPSYIKDAQVVKEANKDYLISLQIEDEVKARLIITKSDEASEALRNVKFRLSGKGKGNQDASAGDVGVILTTNSIGQISASSLYLGEEYTLQETRATGYYLIEGPIKFKITDQGNGNFKLDITEGSNNVGSSSVTVTDNIPTIKIDLQDEKIPTYNLKINKYEKDSDKLLAGAQYLLKGDGLPTNGRILKTDLNGTLEINGLYEYVESEGTAKGGFTGEYLIQEVYAPVGYALDSTEIRIKAQRNASGALEVSILTGEEKIRTVDGNKQYGVENANTESPTVTLSLEDPQIFTLYKKDGETAENIPDAKFVVYQLDENRNVVDYAKDPAGNYIGTLEGIIPITPTMTSSGTNAWTQREDGTWESGGKGVNNLRTELQSNEFTITEKMKLVFDWAVSSESVSYDYVYYTIKNVNTGATIGGDATGSKIGGNGSITDYKKLQFTTVEKELEPGTYTVTFTYRKDSSANSGLDAGFIKNLQVKGTDEGKYVVTTNDLGKATLNLPEGLYKLVEVGAPEGYELSTQEYYFGIGASKPRVTGFGTAFKDQISGSKWEKINATCETSDGGLIAVGYMYESTINPKLVSNGKKDGLIIKYNKDGEIEWYKNYGGSEDDEFTSVTESGTIEHHYYIGGITCSSDFKDVSKNSNSQEGVALYMDTTGNIQNSMLSGDYIKVGKEISGDVSTTVKVASAKDNDINIAQYAWGFVEQPKMFDEYTTMTYSNEAIVSGIYRNYVTINFTGNLQINSSTTITSTGNSQDAVVIKFNNYGIVRWHQQIKSTKNVELAGIIWTEDGNMLVYGSFDGTVTVGSDTATSNGGYDIMMAKFDDSGSYIAGSLFTFGGTQDDVVSSVKATKDGGLLVGGYHYSTTVDIDGDGVNDITQVNKSTTATQYYSDGFVVKFDGQDLSDTATFSFVDQIAGTGFEEVTSVEEITNSKNEPVYVATGCFDSPTVDAAQEEGVFTSKGNTDSFIIGYGDVTKEEEIPQTQEVTVNNDKKKFKITTQIDTLDESGKIVGGTITGNYGVYDKINYLEQEHIQYVEKVTYGQNSTTANQIVITPDTGYKITSIKINGEAYAFVPDSTGKVTLPVFENMQEDKHIEVAFSNTVSSVTVNHLLWNNGATTTPLAESDFITGTIGEQYTTSPNTDISNYELITNKDYYGNNIPTGLNADDYYIPTNAYGTYTAEEQTVQYYYKEKTYTLTVNHYIEDTTTQVPSKNGGTVNTVETTGHKKGDAYTTTVSADIASNYELVSTPANATGTINEDTTVNYYYRLKTSAGIIVHHYIKDTTTQVPNKNGGTVEDETIPAEGGAKVGDSYTTTASTEIAPNYQLVSTPSNATGTYGEEVIEVTYYYEMVDPTIGNKISKSGPNSITEETENVTYTITYESNATDYIGKAQVKLVDQLPFEIDTDKPYQLSGGTYDATTKTVTWDSYLYDLDTYNGTSDITITKTISFIYKNMDFSKNEMENKAFGTTTLLETGKKVSVDTAFKTTYQFDTDISVTKKWNDNNDALKIRPTSVNVTLEATNATIPDNVTKTVTLDNSNNWTHSWPGLEKYNSAGELIDYKVTEEALTGNLAIVYRAEATKDASNNWTITNTYHEPENNTQNIEVEKQWVDNNDSAQKRPESIIIELYQGDSTKVYQQYELNVGTESSHIFQVAKYDNKGYEIEYNVKEKEKNSGDLQFYKNNIQKVGDKYVITNTFEVESGGKTITVEKKWSDNNNANQKRPSSIRIVIQKGEKQEVTSYTLNTATETSHTFELDRYDSNGNEITYIVDEQEVTKDDLKFYTKEIKQDSADKYTITNTFTVPDEKVSVTAKKEWVDNTIQSKRRPDSIIIKLLNGTAEVDTAIANNTNNWEVTFNDLPKYDSTGTEITYKIDEAEVKEGDLKFYTKSINGYTITNTFALPAENTKTVKAIKTWNDNNKNRVSKITLVLTGDGQKYTKTISNAQVDPTNTNNWVAEFEVPIYNANGEEIQYTLGEQAVNKGELDYYIATVDGYTITNTLIIEESGISKTAPNEITDLDSTINYQIEYDVTLNDVYQENAEITITDTLPYKIDETKEYNLDGGKYDATAKTITWKGTYNIADNSITWENSGKEMLRTKLQIAKNISLVYENIPIEATDTKITNNVQGKIELATGAIDTKETSIDTTTNFKKNITIEKQWVGDSKTDEGGNTVVTGRPDEITVQLLADGVLTRTVKLNIQGSWQNEITNLPKYNETTRQPIQYSVTEATVPDGYYLSNIEQNTVEGGEKFTVTNSKYGKILLTKVDNSDNSIKLGGAEFKLEKLKEDNTTDESFTPITKTTSTEEATLGQVEFTELEYGKYKLTETKAPDGYHLLRYTIDVEISGANAEQELTVADKAKPALPATGGIGSIILIVFGTAVLSIVIKKKIQREKGEKIR